MPTKTRVLEVFFSFLLISGGIAPEEKYEFFEIPYAIFINCVFFVELLGCVVGFLNTPVIANRTEILLQTTSHLYFASLHWVLKLNRRQLKNFIHNFHHPEVHVRAALSRDIGQLTATFFLNSMKALLAVFCLFLVLVASISLVMPLFAEFDFKDKYIYVMPFWFVCSDSKVNRFPVPFLCWNIDTFNKYALMNGIVVTLFNIELFAYLTTFAFFSFTQAHFKAHLQVILERIENLGGSGYSQVTEKVNSLPVGRNQVMSRYGGLETRKIDKDFLEFVQIIKHYQYLRRVVNSILTFLQWTVTVSLAAFIAALVSSSFLFVTEGGKKGELLFKIKMASIIANAVVMFFLYCHGAEVTTHVNEDISNALYNMPWYKESIKFRKTVIPFLIQLQKSLGISAFWVYKLNLYFFMGCLRTVYSALNVMLVSIE